jgi:DNA-binding NtrC family response regulator
MKEKILIVEDQFVEANYLRSMLERAGYKVCGIARSVQKAKEIIGQERPGLVLLDIFLSGKLTGIDLARYLREEDIAFIYLSANSNEEVLTAAKATQPYGFLVKPFREKELLIALEIARYRHEHSLESSLRREGILQDQLAAIIMDTSSWQEKLLMTGKALQPYIPFDYFAVGFNMQENNAYCCSFLRIGFDEYQKIDLEGLLMITGLARSEFVQLQLQARSRLGASAMASDEKAFKKECREEPLKNLFATTFSLKSHLFLPLHLSTGAIFDLCFYSRRPDAYRIDHIGLFNRIRQVWEKSIESISVGEGSPRSSERAPHSPDSSPPPPIVQGFDGIIGNSHLLLNVFDHVIQVAPSDTSILILGESGTGKERFADCIHHLSPRKSHPLVKVNCAALPATLIESELFGHEKGSFTGAMERKIGKFEKADKGTIFLDEIGEMPLELQVKLLRVLQEKEIERIGAKAPIRVDVRIIAATNRNLEKEVAEGRFRLDLYYRLNVFPILLPALRDRKEDIPLLAAHFINYFNRKAGKKVSGLSDKALRNMTAYNWPGNIRELEHVIERSILLAKGALIEDFALPGIPAKQAEAANEETRIKTMDENERDHIIAVLKKCNGRIWGRGAAAEVLNMPPTTLKSRMIKLGIKKEYTK